MAARLPFHAKVNGVDLSPKRTSLASPDASVDPSLQFLLWDYPKGRCICAYFVVPGPTRDRHYLLKIELYARANGFRVFKAIELDCPLTTRMMGIANSWTNQKNMSRYLPLAGQTTSRSFVYHEGTEEPDAEWLNLHLTLDDPPALITRTGVRSREPRGTWTGVTRVFSGGQTGVDEAGLAAAYELGIPTDGLAPGLFQREERLDRYNLRYMESHIPLRVSLIGRTQANVRDTDGSLILNLEDSPGTRCTIEFCRTGLWHAGWSFDPAADTDEGCFKPHFVVTRLDDRAVAAARQWIERMQICSLNVAGPRNPANYLPAKNFIIRVLSPDPFMGTR